ncbi:hypothetical protein NMY3_00704 [Candidatus Nitrosocosmicus oleophilus]|uniref:Uncharacterized protein n=1 Tax=Candidatus Nitrosocosmicus oleophilus TaxID=1353260 RepID=A0A654LX57_9ARCH|nr:hypothetical protein NMY3_00704 [Candidatus Nitrosocosmicus oleophilus]
MADLNKSSYTSSLKIGVPQGTVHPIWTYYVYSTNIYNVMRRVLRTFLITNNQFSLTPVEDQEEIQLLLETLKYGYSSPKTTIVSEFGYEQLLINTFHRTFGFFNNPNLKYPRSTTTNSRFKSLLEDSVLLNIAQAIWSKKSTFQLLDDPASLYEQIIDLKSMLLASKTNTIEWLNRYWVNIFHRFFTILNNRKLIREKMGIVEVGPDKILIALGAKFGVNVPVDTLYRFELANYLNTFLLKIERTDWNVDSTEALYSSDNFFKLLFSAYKVIEKRDFKREVQFIAPSNRQTAFTRV